MADEPRTDTPPASQGDGQGTQDRTFTQADVDRVVADRLQRERSKYEGYDDLKRKAEQFDELTARNQSELEQTQGKLTKAEKRAVEAEAKLLRFEVAAEKEVPAKLVPLLTATNREGLEAQAALILENAKPAPPDFDGGPRDPAPTPKTPEQEHNDLLLGLFGSLPR